MEKIFKIEPVIIDTGIIYALADRQDSWHQRALDFLESFNGRLIVPSPVIPEACYLLNSYLGPDAEISFLRSLADRELSVEHFGNNDLVRCLELLETYGDANIGFVDASIVSITERLKITRIFTTDRRHFSIIRPLHCKRFTLLP